MVIDCCDYQPQTYPADCGNFLSFLISLTYQINLVLSTAIFMKQQQICRRFQVRLAIYAQILNQNFIVREL